MRKHHTELEGRIIGQQNYLTFFFPGLVILSLRRRIKSQSRQLKTSSSSPLLKNWPVACRLISKLTQIRKFIVYFFRYVCIHSLHYTLGFHRLERLLLQRQTIYWFRKYIDKKKKNQINHSTNSFPCQFIFIIYTIFLSYAFNDKTKNKSNKTIL